MAGYANPFAPQMPGMAGAPGVTGVTRQTATAPGIPNPADPNSYGEDYYLNDDPDAAFTRYLANMHWNQANDPMARYAAQQQGRVYNQYKSVAAANVNEGFYDYLRRVHPDLQNDYQSQSPEQRGDFSSRIMTPRARWVTG